MIGPTKTNAILNSINYSVEFVPFSRSRNRDKKDKSLNWIVTLERHGNFVKADYMQGQAHVHNFNNPTKKNSRYFYKYIQNEIVNKTCEDGKAYSYREKIDNLRIDMKVKNQPQPKLEDVLYCLISNADVLQYRGFQEWAECFGYGTDSIKANEIYQACLKITLEMKQLFNCEEMEILQEHFQDY